MKVKSQQMKVKLKGGGPWGFRLQGGPGTGSPLTVSKIRRKSKAYNNLYIGDLLISVNGILCDQLTYDQVMSIADKTGFEIILEVERKQTSAEDFEASICRNSTDIKSTLMNVLETETTVVKNYGETITKEMNSLNFNSPFNKKISETVPSVELGNSTSGNDKGSSQDSKESKPCIPSEFSTKTATEVTTNEQKFEKLKTEEFCEKLDNQNNTIIRTTYEESKKSIPSSLSSDNEDHNFKTHEDANSQIMRITSEVCKKENSEMTTDEIIRMSSLPSSDSAHISSTILDSVIEDVKILTEQLELELPFATPVAHFESSAELEEQSDSSTSSKKKKMFSSSSFYEEPHAIYPTVEEQFEMAKKIAESLAADTNSKSKGANMFFKRAKRSTKWIHEGPEPSSESVPETPEILAESPCALTEGRNGQMKVRKLKLVLDPRHPVDLASLRSTGHNISEHNVVSPEVCHGLVRDLESPIGKGSALFAKRKKKSSEWIVDEEKVKALMKAHESDLNTVKNVEILWNTPSYISNSSSLKSVHPDELAETVIAAADVKRRDSVPSNDQPKFALYKSPIIPTTPTSFYNDLYKARAPKGWSAVNATIEACSPADSAFARLTPESVEPFPSYSTLSSLTNAKKFNFQNFNTLPRKWRAQH